MDRLRLHPRIWIENATLRISFDRFVFPTALCRPGQLKQRARGHISINGWKCYYSTLCNYILCHKWSISHSAMHCCCNSTWITWCHTSGSSRTVFLTLSLISSRFTASSLLVTKMGPNRFCCRIWFTRYLSDFSLCSSVKNNILMIHSKRGNRHQK